MRMHFHGLSPLLHSPPRRGGEKRACPGLDPGWGFERTPDSIRGIERLERFEPEEGGGGWGC
jgi:hypothetical protein